MIEQLSKTQVSSDMERVHCAYAILYCTQCYNLFRQSNVVKPFLDFRAVIGPEGFLIPVIFSVREQSRVYRHLITFGKLCKFFRVYHNYCISRKLALYVVSLFAMNYFVFISSCSYLKKEEW